MAGEKLLEAISRLEMAVGHAERAVAARIEKSGASQRKRDKAVKEALGELDLLIGQLGGNAPGEGTGDG